MSKAGSQPGPLHSPSPTSQATEESVATRFFKGPENVKRLLTEGVKNKVGQPSGGALQNIDALCRLGTNGDHGWDDLKSDHTLMTPFLFTVLSLELNLKVDEVLVPDLSKDEDLKWVLDHMTRNKARLAAGSGSDAPVSMEAAAPIYVILKALEEIEPPRSAATALASR
jgi:hypothetical protein